MAAGFPLFLAFFSALGFLENEVMYPEVRTRVPDLEGGILESFEEHHVAVLAVHLLDNQGFATDIKLELIGGAVADSGWI